MVAGPEVVRTKSVCRSQDLIGQRCRDVVPASEPCESVPGSAPENRVGLHRDRSGNGDVQAMLHEGLHRHGRGSARWPREAPARPSPRRTPPFPPPPARPCCSEIRCRQRTASRTGRELATGATGAKPVPMIASRSPGSRHCSARMPATIRPACRRKLPRPARTARCRPAHPALRLRTTPPSACPRCWVASGSLPSSPRTASTARPTGCAWCWNRPAGRLP